MSYKLQRTYSLRKTIRPIIDRDEEEDENRRDATGRKRVDVVECLLDSSSDADEIDDYYPIIDSTSPILWLNFNEISHIRTVLAQTMLSVLMINDENQASKIQHGRLCFRCHRSIYDWSFFLPSFLRLTRPYHCSICKQSICKSCASTKFSPPARKLAIPIRIQTLLKPNSFSISTWPNIEKETNHDQSNSRTICFDCFQVFHEHRQTSSSRVIEPIAASPFRRTLSLPPASSQTTTTNEHRHTRRRRPIQITNCKIETKTITTTSVIAEL